MAWPIRIVPGLSNANSGWNPPKQRVDIPTGFADTLARERCEGFGKERKYPSVAAEPVASEMALPGGMKLHQCGKQSRQVLGSDLACHAAAPAGTVLRRAQVLPLMRGNVFEGIAGRTEDELG